METSVLLAGLLFLLGLGLLIKGGGWFVDAAVWLSELTGVPKLIIGATIVSFCTTLPELLVSSFAVTSGVPDMGVGNALGSVICNTCVILGISMLFMPREIQKRTFSVSALFLIVSILLTGIFILDLKLSIYEALILLCVMFFYMRYAVRAVRKTREPANNANTPDDDKSTMTKNRVKFFLGVTGIVFGARLLVDNGAVLARAAGISDAVIGLTIVAIGTSLPELVTTISAVVKKEFSLSVGNIIGANILNIAFIMSVCGMISPGGLSISLQKAAFFSSPIPQSLYIDLPVALFVTLIVAVPGMIKGRLYRWQGFTVMVCYGLYIAYLIEGAF